MPTRGGQTPGSGPHGLYWNSACAPRARRGWDRVTVREPQVTRVCAKRPRRSVLPLSWGPGLAGFRGTSSPPRIPVPVCLGHRGPVGRSVWPWKGGQGSRPWSCAQDCKYEKPLRSRHQCKYTMVDFQTRACVQVHPTQRSMHLDPEVGFSLVLRAGLRDLQKGWSNSSSSVYILIWGLQGH